MANAGLIAKIAVFDPTYPFRPICFSRPQGLAVMNGPMRERFKERVLLNLTYAKMLAKDGTIYVSRWVWWRDKDGIWNLSRQIAERLHRDQPRGKKPDYVEVLKWVIVDARIGKGVVEVYRERALEHLNKAQVAEAKRRAAAWLKAHGETP